MYDTPPFWMYIVGFLLMLGPLITLHELGHYLVGRWFGVKADAFSIGFGKELAGWTDRRGTRWRLAAIPLGGYVQFKGDLNPASMPDAEANAAASEAERDGSFHHAALWKRALIVFAGPATNILITLAIFAGFFMVLGKPVPADPADANVIGQVAEQSAAAEAGLVEGDRILAIDGDPIVTFEDITDAVMLHPGKDVMVAIERGGERMRFALTVGESIETDRFGNESRLGRLGVLSRDIEYRQLGPLEAGAESVDASIGLMRMMLTGIGQILTGDRSLKELGGPIKIAKYSGEQLSLGPEAFISFAALISLNLAFINLLPIPALDGGHLAFYAAEAVRRKPVGPRGQEWAYRTGIVLVLALMVVVTVNDLITLPLFGS